MSDDLKDLFPHWYKVYRRSVKHPPKGFEIRNEFVGPGGFANWLKHIFAAQDRLDKRDERLQRWQRRRGRTQ